jgi:hypothetical protein
MNTTAAAKHRVYRNDLQRLARLIEQLQGEGTDEKKADIVPMFAKRLIRIQLFIAVVAAMLTLFLVSVFAREKVGVPGIADKALAYWEQRYYQQHKKRDVYGGELGYAPDGDKWCVRSDDFRIVQNYNRTARSFPFLSAGPAPSGNPPIVSFGGSNYLDKIKLDYFIAHTMGSYNRPFDANPLWQNSAPSTITCNNANSNFPSIAVTGGANPYDVGEYTLTSFGNSTQKSTTKDWWANFNAAIPTHWTSYPTEEIMFGPGARVGRFDQNVTTYSATAVPAIPHSLAAYGSHVVYYDGHYDTGR